MDKIVIPVSDLKGKTVAGVGDYVFAKLLDYYASGATTDPGTGDGGTTDPGSGGGTETPTEPGGDSSALPSVLIPVLKTHTVMVPYSKPGTTSEPQNLYATKAEVDPEAKKYFYNKNGAVAFKVNAGGVHSSGSKYPRSEAREMKDADWTKGAWSNATGRHVLEASLSFTHNFVKKPELVVGQIHDGADDVLQIRAVGKRLIVAGSDNKYNQELDADLPQGTRFNYQIVAENGRISVYYGRQGQAMTKKFDVARSGTGWYFKWGAYAQTSPEVSGESKDATAEVLFYSAKITHS